MQIQTNRQMKHSKGKKTKKKRKLLVGMVLSFFLFSAVAAGAVWWQFENTLGKIANNPSTEITQQEDEKPVIYNQEPISLVIIGTDSRNGLGMLNTDVVIVAALNPQTKHVTMMPIPRDTGVKIPGYSGYSKINAVYARGEVERRAAERNNKPVTETGPSLLKKTLEDALGIPINYYVMTDFEGFEKVVDELGGVEVEVDKSMRYDDPSDGTHINLQPGLQVLNGNQALGFVRHRKDNRGSKYFSNDFDRGMRQQVVIKAVVDKMKSFTGISSYFSVMNVAGDHIRTDLSKEQIKGLIMDFKSIGSENIASLETGGYWDAASSHTIIPKENLQQIQLAFQQEMGIEGGDFQSSIRVEAPKQQKQTVVNRAVANKVEAAPKKQEEAAGVEEQVEKTKPEKKTEEVETPSKVDQTPTSDVADPAAKPSKTPPPESEKPTTKTPPKQSGSEKVNDGMLAPPVNATPPPSEVPVQPPTAVPQQQEQSQEMDNNQG